MFTLKFHLVILNLVPFKPICNIFFFFTWFFMCTNEIITVFYDNHTSMFVMCALCDVVFNTGPYMLTAGVVTMVLSKELWVVDHGFTDFVAFWLLVTYLLNNEKVMNAWYKFAEKGMKVFFFF